LRAAGSDSIMTGMDRTVYSHYANHGGLPLDWW
jgi:hypothetical protein